MPAQWGHEFEQLQETVEDRGAWSVAVKGITKSQTQQLNNLTLFFKHTQNRVTLN